MKNKIISEIDEYRKMIVESVGRWNYIAEHGCSDPFWSDGCNMNLVRNHTIYAKRNIEKLCEENGLEFPIEYNIPLPPEMDDNYMARADEIRRNADKILTEYLDDPEYLYLLRKVGSLTDKQKESTGIPAALNYVNCLRNAISRNDLITMRRHEKAEFYKSSFKECRERLEKEDSEKIAESEQKSKSMLPLGQLSLMDLFEL